MKNEVLVEHVLVRKTAYNTDNLKRYLYLGIKRLFDIIIGLIGCLALVFILPVVKILYVLTKDYASIFLPPQERIGKNGKVFKFYKIRTMVVGADDILYKLLEEDESIRKEYEVNKKLDHDPRVTKVGKWLRKFSIDETPQFINILKGDMSFIGNRPYLLREKEDMGYQYRIIVKTKPGLTGYWQTHGRNLVTFKERLKIESYYSRNQNFLMDIKIFFKTIEIVLCKKGAK